MESSLYHFASGLEKTVGLSACEEFHFLCIHISSHMKRLLAFEHNVQSCIKTTFKHIYIYIIYRLKQLASGLMTIAANGAHRKCTIFPGLTDTIA